MLKKAAFIWTKTQQHIILWNIITILNNRFLFEYIFKNNIPVMVEVELHSSEIILIHWFGSQETFIIIFKVENSCAA